MPRRGPGCRQGRGPSLRHARSILGGCGSCCGAGLSLGVWPPLPSSASSARHRAGTGALAAEPFGRLAGGQMAGHRSGHEGRAKRVGARPGCWHGQRRRCTANPVPLAGSQEVSHPLHVPLSPRGDPLCAPSSKDAKRGTRGRGGGTGSAAGFCQRRVQHAVAGLRTEPGAPGLATKDPGEAADSHNAAAPRAGEQSGWARVLRAVSHLKFRECQLFPVPSPDSLGTRMALLKCKRCPGHLCRRNPGIRCHLKGYPSIFAPKHILF